MICWVMEKHPLKKSKVNFEDFSEQLVKLINELNFKKIHLVGFSLGALIARHFASKHSDRVKFVNNAWINI